MNLSALDLAKITNREPNANMQSVVAGLEAFPAGLGQPHRLAHYLAQLCHESGGFRYDREVWGPTPAQKRYEGRKDLGNTQPGDGYKFRGRTGIQITGRENTAAFRDWCRQNVSHKCPDFEADPDAMNDDPWEGLGPVWYWDTRNLNALADKNDISGITRRINGGLNGFADRKEWYVKCALVLLGHGPRDVVAFQKAHKLTADGIAGPKTVGALHTALCARPAAVAPKPVQKPSTGSTDVPASFVAALVAGAAVVIAAIKAIFGG